MDLFRRAFAESVRGKQGMRLASLIQSHPGVLNSKEHRAKAILAESAFLPPDQDDSWSGELFRLHLQILREVDAHCGATAALLDLLEEQASLLVRAFAASEGTLWMHPVVMQACRDLWLHLASSDSNVTRRAQEAARIVNRAFTACLTDRTSVNGRRQSRKWAVLPWAATLCRMYQGGAAHRLLGAQQEHLCGNVIRAVEGAELPAFSDMNRSGQAEWFYRRSLYLTKRCTIPTASDERLREALEGFVRALHLCRELSAVSPSVASRNASRIVEAIVPIRLLLDPIRRPPRSILNETTLSLVEHLACGSIGRFFEGVAVPALYQRGTRFLWSRLGISIGLVQFVRRIHWHLLAQCADPKQAARIPLELIVSLLERPASFEACVLPANVQQLVSCIAEAIQKRLLRAYIALDHGVLVLALSAAFFPRPTTASAK